ncbi:uncharacterized protein RAG0_02413 [Rhynchosporium agropyri]|uniref:Uncharacterized protein n=1 Tax=Rhynchosporium agropyri TaxID=914238 RepID=A0A1E1K166_9HELO|nr:uncharacterized protein RAG0_02413 [Rhynchosporium agropyri]
MALNNLPWSSIPWSMNRGLKDLLLAVGIPTLNRYRDSLASLLKGEILLSREALVAMQWSREFVYGPMSEIAFAAVTSGVGNSGDIVRIVTAAVDVFLVRNGFSALDKDNNRFWKGIVEVDVKSDPMIQLDSENVGEVEADAIVALTKFFVLEWSQELDYQLYHDLLVELFLAS